MRVRNVSAGEGCTVLSILPERESVITILCVAAGLRERFILCRLRRRKECISAVDAQQRTEQKRRKAGERGLCKSIGKGRGESE